jgi:hypothetical protein
MPDDLPRQFRRTRTAYRRNPRARDAIAQQIGTTASNARSPAGHYSAVRHFGPVQYRAVTIPNRDDENEG